jgi:hypothetical protein
MTTRACTVPLCDDTCRCAHAQYDRKFVVCFELFCILRQTRKTVRSCMCFIYCSSEVFTECQTNIRVGKSIKWFDPGSVHVGFVVDKVTLGQVFPPVLRFPSVSLIPPMLHYLEKWKNWFFSLHLYHRVAQCSVSSEDWGWRNSWTSQ